MASDAQGAARYYAAGDPTVRQPGAVTSDWTVWYVGSLREGGTSRARMLAMKDLGLKVLEFDVMAYMNSARWPWGSMGHRFSLGPAVSRINSDLLSAVRSHRGKINCIWIDKGVFIHQQTLQSLRKETGALLVHYTPDPQVSFQVEKLRHFRPAIPEYDFLFTTKPFDVDGYRDLGARNVHLVDQSYDDRRLFPRKLTDEQRRLFGSQVCFIGQYTAHYADLLETAMANGAVRLWGPNWRKRSWRHRWISRILVSDGVWGDSYPLALSAADIGLCFLSKRYPETTTTRTFEIPACGTFMLAERTPDHLRLFAEGEEAEFFGDKVELAEKIRFYLANPQQRKRIAAAGYARCVRSGYGNRARMQSLLTIVGAMKAEGAAAVA